MVLGVAHERPQFLSLSQLYDLLLYFFWYLLWVALVYITLYRPFVYRFSLLARQMQIRALRLHTSHHTAAYCLYLMHMYLPLALLALTR